ncbi:Trehalose-6-phosphate hydrolase [Rhodobacteraceae bacterium THAF1]|uniref:alpha-amylase family glycosyl hydrolase n=1 Tax=Palleronia sp. THAF1 TaxID=2587842 RepID=UPI000F3D8F87|nr:alpha-amylase family glycosyl hydrolase [Palleronia sp. THAF1]QFU09935.1 Trehalose-6-phosphate hydrolase [Palleronia sp. THAF1]VDC17162.1 Trehalose-6-phosphate hydrolase [Rhodobacteraceae bacterium THAF1]
MGRKWPANPLIYEVYPRSFNDTTGSGVGDLNGITEKLDYIASLNVDAVWLCPFYTSPLHDGGYDVADHRAVAERHGTLEDFDRLVKEAHDRDLLVMVDSVFNHTSTDHAWFQASLDGDEEKAECYVWRDPKPDGTPPNNWISQFGPPAWTWNHRRQQYYHHQFLSCQANLNLRHPLVQRMFRETLEFWLDRGVDGFRFDVVTAYLFDPDMPDNPPARPVVASRVTGPNHNPYSYQDHVYDLLPGDGAAYTENMRKWVGDDIYLIGESNTGNDAIEISKSFTTDGRLDGCYNTLPPTVSTNPTALADILRQLDGDWCAPWWFSSHDQVRHNSDLGDGSPESAKFFAMLLATLPGAALMYQGEELGLPQLDLTKEETTDPFDLLYWPDAPGREPPRIPIPWRKDLKNFGFTKGEPWLPMRWDKALSVEAQEDNAESVLNFYRRAMAFRKETRIAAPDKVECDASDTAMSLRITKGDERWLVVFNFGDDQLPVPTRQGMAPVLSHGWDGRRLPKWGAAVWEGVEEREETACN